MSAPSLSDRLALVAADPVLVDHPVVAGLVVAVDALETELAALRARVAAQDEELADLPDPLPLEMTKHRAHAVGCPGCGTRTRAPFPQGDCI